MKTIRIDGDVRNALLSQRRPGETNHSDVIDRLLRVRALREKLNDRGLTTSEIAELHWLDEGRA